jgi:hypothetical protein
MAATIISTTTTTNQAAGAVTTTIPVIPAGALVVVRYTSFLGAVGVPTSANLTFSQRGPKATENGTNEACQFFTAVNGATRRTNEVITTTPGSPERANVCVDVITGADTAAIASSPNVVWSTASGTTPSQTITRAGQKSLVLAVYMGDSNGATITPNGSTTTVLNGSDGGANHWWFGNATTPGGPGSITIGGTTSATEVWVLSVMEIPSGGGIFNAVAPLTTSAGFTTTDTFAALTTDQGGLLLVVDVSIGGGTSLTTGVGVSGGGLTWAQLNGYYFNQGPGTVYSGLWWALAPSALSAQVISVSWPGANDSSASLYVLGNAKSFTGLTAGVDYATSQSNGTSTAASTSLTTKANGSWALASGLSWQGAYSAPAANTTTLVSLNGSAAVARSDNPLAVGTYALGFTITTSQVWQMAGMEVLYEFGGVGAGSISPLVNFGFGF